MSTISSTIERAAVALAKAALNSSGQGQQSNRSEQSKERKSGISTGHAILLGAGLMAAGQALVKSRGPDILDSVRHGLAERLQGGSATAPEEEDFEEDEYEDYEDEPEDEGDDDFDDEDSEDYYEEEDEPEDDADEDFEDEDYEEDDEDEDEDEDDAPRRKAASGGRRRK